MGTSHKQQQKMLLKLLLKHIKKSRKLVHFKLPQKQVLIQFKT